MYRIECSAANLRNNADTGDAVIPLFCLATHIFTCLGDKKRGKRSHIDTKKA